MSSIDVVPAASSEITGVCECDWRPGLPCPNRAEFILRNTLNAGFMICCGQHKQGYLSRYGNSGVVAEAFTAERAKELQQIAVKAGL